MSQKNSKTDKTPAVLKLYSPTSKRQLAKAARADKLDKFGYSKATSRKQRRAARRSHWSRTYTTGAGTQQYTLNPGENQTRRAAGTSQDTSMYVYGGGSFKP